MIYEYVQAYKYSTPKALHFWTPAGIAEEIVAQELVATLVAAGLLRADLPG